MAGLGSHKLPVGACRADIDPPAPFLRRTASQGPHQRSIVGALPQPGQNRPPRTWVRAAGRCATPAPPVAAPRMTADPSLATAAGPRCHARRRWWAPDGSPSAGATGSAGGSGRSCSPTNPPSMLRAGTRGPLGRILHHWSPGLLERDGMAVVGDHHPCVPRARKNKRLRHLA